MAITRRILNQNLERRVFEEEPLHLGKPATKNDRQGRARVTLGDIGNVNKHDSKAKKQTKGKIVPLKENGKEKQNDERMIRKEKAMSICEPDSSKCIKNDEANDLDIRISKSISVDESSISSIVDIDKDSANDPFQCPEYAADIFNYLKILEKKLSISDYMHNQSEINERMRSILIDWLIQVHGRFGLLQETLYLTVNIIDRLLACHVVSRSKLQLVGVSAMLLASKYEETYAPEIGDFVYISDNSYTKGQIKKMEQLVLKTLNFDLSNPLCLHFLRRNSKAALSDAKQHTLAKYFMELTLVDYKMSRLLPSQIAAASLFLAGKIINNSDWSKTVEHYSSYTENDLTPVVKSLSNLVIRAESSKLQAVRSKYASSKHMKVSTMPELKELISKYS